MTVLAPYMITHLAASTNRLHHGNLLVGLLRLLPGNGPTAGGRVDVCRVLIMI